MKLYFKKLITLSAVSIALINSNSEACLNISGEWKLESPHCFTPAWTHRNYSQPWSHVWVEKNQTVKIVQTDCNSFSISAPESALPESRKLTTVKNFQAAFHGIKQKVTITDDAIVTKSRDFDPAGIGLYGPYPSNVYEWTARYELSGEPTTLNIDVTRIDNRALSSHDQCIYTRVTK